MASNIVEILNEEELRRTLKRLASQVTEHCRDLNQLVLVGVLTHGLPLAEILAQHITDLEHVQVPVGGLDITFYRDDLDRVALRTPGKTNLPTDLSGKSVVLVDDVIYSGRTIRAALNAIHDYGRPSTIQLLALIDRGHRELPIHPDFVGKVLPTSREERVKVYLHQTDRRDAVELIRSTGSA